MVVIDAGYVESIDTAGLQLLAAFANSVRAQSRTVEWKNPTPEFCELADLLDLSESLGTANTAPAPAPADDFDDLCPVF